MSLIDTTFGPLGPALISKYGSSAVFIRKGANTYNTTTGVVSVAETRINTKAVITRVSPREYEGVYQSTDVKIIPNPQDIGNAGITVSDAFEYSRNNVTITAKVIDIKEYRGDNVVLSVAIARPQ